MLRGVIGLIVAGLFLGLTFERLDWNAFHGALASASLAPLLLGACLLAVDFSLRIVRWWWMLQVFEPGLPLRNCAGPFLASFAINNLFPLRAGDLFRAIGFREQLQSPAARTLGTVFVERLLDLCVLLGFLFAGLWTLPIGILPTLFIRAAVWLALVCFSVVLIVLIMPAPIRRKLSRLESWSALRDNAFLGRLQRWGEQFIDTLVALGSPLVVVQLIGLSVAVWMLEGAIFATVVWSLTANVGGFGPWFALATGTLATVLPSTPGYVGTFDYFATVGLMAYGANKESAVAFSLLVHFLLWLPITLAGGLYLAAPKGRILWLRLRVAQSSKA